MDGMQNWPIEAVELIKKQQQEIEELKQRMTALEEENRTLRELVQKLEARLKAYENPHTPSSKQRFKGNHGGSSSGKRGAPKGHFGATREQLPPTRIELHALGTCPLCGGRIIKSLEVLRRIVEEIPEPQPAEVTEHVIETGVCERCGAVVAESNLPEEGDFGKNVLTHVTLMRLGCLSGK
jgi:transposase